MRGRGQTFCLTMDAKLWHRAPRKYVLVMCAVVALSSCYLPSNVKLSFASPLAPTLASRGGPALGERLRPRPSSLAGARSSAAGTIYPTAAAACAVVAFASAASVLYSARASRGSSRAARHVVFLQAAPQKAAWSNHGDLIDLSQQWSMPTMTAKAVEEDTSSAKFACRAAHAAQMQTPVIMFYDMAAAGLSAAAAQMDAPSPRRASAALFVGGARRVCRRERAGRRSARRSAAACRASHRQMGAQLSARAVQQPMEVPYDPSRIRTRVQVALKVPTATRTASGREASNPSSGGATDTQRACKQLWECSLERSRRLFFRA